MPFFAHLAKKNSADIPNQIISPTMDLGRFFTESMNETQHWIFHSAAHDTSGERHLAESHPHSLITSLVRSEYGDRGEPVALVVASIPWDLYFTDLLGVGTKAVYVVVHNTCDQMETFVVNGADVTYVGSGDFHETEYDSMGKHLTLRNGGEEESEHSCVYSFHLYPSTEFREGYESRRPKFFTAAMALVFLLTAIMFRLYLFVVNRRQNRLLRSAIRTSNIVASLFPSNVRQRLLEQAEAEAEAEETAARGSSSAAFLPKRKLQSFLAGDTEEDEVRSAPIADFFPEVTIMFADLVGFSAWCSMREPSQVFTLLETIFKSFDVLAKRRKVRQVMRSGSIEDNVLTIA